MILLYLESFGNPRKVQSDRAPCCPNEAYRRGQGGPIDSAGSRAAASHTGALASSDAVVDACSARRRDSDGTAGGALRRRGAAVAPAGAAGTASGDPHQRRRPRHPRRRRVRSERTPAPCPRDATRSALRAFLPAAASVDNPVDMLASAPARALSARARDIFSDEHVDSVIAIFIPPLVTDPATVAAAIAGRRPATGPDKPVLGVFMRAEGAPEALAPIPAYAFPESAALALARVTTYGRWRATQIEAAPELDHFDRAGIRSIVEEVLARGGGWAAAGEASALLAAAGIECAASNVAANVEQAVLAGSAVGYPVALKALGPTLLHKTERAAVALNLVNEAALRAAYADFASRFGTEMTSALVQQMVPRGVEMIVGAVHDPQFGPVIACGTGGVLVEILADTSFRLHPLSASDAREMIGDLRGARLLKGYRGAPAADEAALRDDTAARIRTADHRPGDPGARPQSRDRPARRCQGRRCADPDRRGRRAADRTQGPRPIEPVSDDGLLVVVIAVVSGVQRAALSQRPPGQSGGRQHLMSTRIGRKIEDAIQSRIRRPLFA